MMQKKIRMILICFFVLLSLLPYMESEAYNNIQGCIYFYSPTCSSCIRLSEYLDEKEITDYVNKYDITEQMELFNSYCEYYNVPKEERYAPICFYEEKYAVGYENIINCLNKINAGVSTPVLQADNAKTVSVDIIQVILSGLVNGVNPCSISILLFLLTILVEINLNDSIKICYAFIFGKFIMFMALGTIFFGVLSKMNTKVFLKLFEIIFTAICILLFFGNLYDAIMVKLGRADKIRVKLPDVMIAKINTSIKKVVSLQNAKYMMPFCFLLGVGVSCGEFLCTGQIYLSTIVSLIVGGEKISYYGVVMLFIYDIAYIVPLIICIHLVHRGVRVLKLSQLFVEKLWIVKVINAVLFLLFSGYMLMNIFLLL